MFRELGADFFATDNRGRGLLHVAAKGDIKSFQSLLDMGLDIILEDKNYQTAIDIAAACGNNDILGLFEKKKR